jgi:hypothetical protein
MYPACLRSSLHPNALQQGSEGIWDTVNNAVNWIHLTADPKPESKSEHK